ncbi:MAG: hypothetical protein LC722_06000 [Actinobacteria bacterium]|nr:hypothetical protein [Actinomycetota bacterium]
MASNALIDWEATGLARLDELEAIHQRATGAGPGRRWGTEQLNRSLFTALVAQFQLFCRALHDEAVEVHLGATNPRQVDVLRHLLTQGRRLDQATPRTDALGADFGRLGFDLIDTIKAAGADAKEALRALDLVIDFRNAIVHGNETRLEALIAQGEIKATKTMYRRFRKTLGALAVTMDSAVAEKLGRLLALPSPW